MSISSTLRGSRAFRRAAASVAIVALWHGSAITAQRPAAPAPSQSAGGTRQAAASDAIVPFTINVPDSVLRDLKQRLAMTRFPDEIEGAGWDYGTSLTYVKELVTYWRDKFDWRAQERRLNQFPQFKTNIAGLNIHFIHQRSREPRAMPLLLLNGWPSTIDEYSKVIGPLTDPVKFGGRAEDAFHVIIPVMPGYGFSDKPREKGYDPERMASLWQTLMARLGYHRYAVSGTDWGGAVAGRLAIRDADHVAALHMNTCVLGGAPPPPTANRPAASAAGDPSIGGYVEIQSTKPETLGYGLSDSPVALAAWIVEKFHGWPDHDGDLEKVYSKDALLTGVMIYWVTNTGTSSARLYYESRHQDGRILPSFIEGFAPKPPANRLAVPIGCGSFPNRYDIKQGRNRAASASGSTTPSATAAPANAAAAPAAAARPQSPYNVVRQTTMPRGGHFPAYEEPQLWLDDVRGFLGPYRQ